MTLECECGNERRLGDTACQRCLELDGDWVNSVTESEIIAALQQAGGSLTADEIAHLAGIERRTVDIRIPALIKSGRVRKRTKAGFGPDAGDVTMYSVQEG